MIKPCSLRLIPKGIYVTGMYFCRNHFMNPLSLTKLYDLLTLKLGKDTAGHLTVYIEDKVRDEVGTRSMSLPAIEDLSKLDTKIDAMGARLDTRINSLETKINAMALDILKLDTKISENKSELIKWMFLFWIAQAGTSFAFILLFIKR